MAEIKRIATRVVDVAGVKIGGNNPVVIQSMCNTDTKDVKATINQALALEEAGCEIIRVAVPDMEAAKAIKEIKKGINIPLVADIHFDHRLAIAAIEAGADKIRINPGNMRPAHLSELCGVLKSRNIPVRVGVNSGSLQKDIYAKYNGITAEALVESAMNGVELLEQNGIEDIVISLKASDVLLTIEAYTLLSTKTNHPLHIGVTEAGTVFSGTVNSAVGLGVLLYSGIGDTLRVSLTSDPAKEIMASKKILEALGLRKFGAKLISCPTCGRCGIDIVSLAEKVDERLMNVHKPITVAVMGCEVNGPGEAREADFGIAGGRGEGLLFRKGEIIAKIPENQLLDALFHEIDKF